MDSDVAGAIESLPVDADDVSIATEIDIYQLELDMRRDALELVMKREQVDHLREELDREKETGYTMKVNLQQVNDKVGVLERQNRNLKQNWDEFNAKYQLLVDRKLQSTVLHQENASLKELLRNSEYERIKLQRKVDDLELQREINQENIGKVMEENNNIREEIAKCEETIKGVIQDKEEMMELHKNLGEFRQHLANTEPLKTKIADYEKRINQLEEELLSSRVAATTLQNLLENYSLPKASQQTDLHNYFEEKANDLEKQLEAERELTLMQNERINKDKEANMYLCCKLEEAERKLSYFISKGEKSKNTD